MTVKRKSGLERPVIDLDGPQGNAFFLMGQVKNYGRQLKYGNVYLDGILTRMKSGDYYNLVSVFNEAFGEFVDIVTENEDLLERIGN